MDGSNPHVFDAVFHRREESEDTMNLQRVFSHQLTSNISYDSIAKDVDVIGSSSLNSSYSIANQSRESRNTTENIRQNSDDSFNSQETTFTEDNICIPRLSKSPLNIDINSTIGEFSEYKQLKECPIKTLSLDIHECEPLIATQFDIQCNKLLELLRIFTVSMVDLMSWKDQHIAKNKSYAFFEKELVTIFCNISRG